MVYSILHRWTRSTVAVIEAPTYARALEWAARRGISLIDIDLKGLILSGAFLARADLRGAALSNSDLTGTYLRKADLRGADLQDAKADHAFLGGADLRQADLRRARLLGADLRGAKFCGADLRETVVTGAKLQDALLDWRWVTLPAEILRAHGGSPDCRIVVDLAFQDDDRPWAWLNILQRHPRDGSDRALTILADWVRDGDNAPEILRLWGRTASEQPQTDDAEIGSSADCRLVWTCRQSPECQGR